MTVILCHLFLFATEHVDFPFLISPRYSVLMNQFEPGNHKQPVNSSFPGITVLGSGSRGNSLVVHGLQSNFLIDAGFSCKQTMARMSDSGVDPDSIGAILVSHEHDDHVKGVRLLSRKLRAPVFCNRSVGNEIRNRGLDAKGAINIFSVGAPFTWEEFTINPFSVPHDAWDTVGFRIDCRGYRIGVATDLGYATQVVLHHLQDCDSLVVESNHDPAMLRNSSRPWPLKQRINGRHGHLSNNDCMEMLRKVLAARTRNVIFAHASEECNSYSLVDECAAQCLEKLERPDVLPLVARQNAPLETVRLV